MVRTHDVDAKLSYVEHSGAAIEAGRNDLKDIEFRMQTQGLQLLVPQPGGKSATGEVHDEAKENSSLAMMATSLGDGLETSLDYMAQFTGAGPDQGGSLVVNTDFGVGLAAATDLQVLLQAVTANDLSRETFWSELKRRDVLSDDFDPEVEADRIANQAPALNGTPMNLDSEGAKDKTDSKEPAEAE